MSDKILYFCTVWEIFPSQSWKVFLHPAINWLRCSRPGSKPSTHPQLNPLTMDFNHFSALFTVMQSKRCHFGTVTCEKPAPNFVDMTSNIVNSNSVCNIEKVSIDSKQFTPLQKKVKKDCQIFMDSSWLGKHCFLGWGVVRAISSLPTPDRVQSAKALLANSLFFGLGRKIIHPSYHLIEEKQWSSKVSIPFLFCFYCSLKRFQMVRYWNFLQLMRNFQAYQPHLSVPIPWL